MVAKHDKESGSRWSYRLGITINSTRLIVLLCGSILAGMALFFYYNFLHTTDYRESVAIGTLFETNGKPDVAAFTAALNTSFPKGTPSALIVKFAKDQDGWCIPSEQVNECSIPLESSFCLTDYLDLKFPTGILDQPVHVSFRQFGC